ncbi:MAG: hypothetical protein ACTSU2_13300 [Promethearchaeota archaeon]
MFNLIKLIRNPILIHNAMFILPPEVSLMIITDLNYPIKFKQENIEFINKIGQLYHLGLYASNEKGYTLIYFNYYKNVLDLVKRMDKVLEKLSEDYITRFRYLVDYGLDLDNMEEREGLISSIEYYFSITDPIRILEIKTYWMALFIKIQKRFHLDLKITETNHGFIMNTSSAMIGTGYFMGLLQISYPINKKSN